MVQENTGRRWQQTKVIFGRERGRERKIERERQRECTREKAKDVCFYTLALAAFV